MQPLVSDEPIINLLIDWAVSTQRHGAHRAVVVAKLLEKRQADLRSDVSRCSIFHERSSVILENQGIWIKKTHWTVGPIWSALDKGVYIRIKRWLGVAKVSRILCHWGVQLILAYSWARLAILVAGKGRGGMFLFFLFLYFHSCSSLLVPLIHLFYNLFYLFSPFLWEMTQNDPQGLTCR